jgi:hypothetical protein
MIEVKNVHDLDEVELAGLQITSEEIAGTVNDIYRCRNDGISDLEFLNQLQDLICDFLEQTIG